MILGYNFVDRTATLMAYDGTRFTIPNNWQPMNVPPRGGVKISGTFDWRPLLSESKIRMCQTADEVTAAMRIVEQWPDCWEKFHYLEIMRRWLSEERLRRKEMYISIMVSLYGRDRGHKLSKAVHDHQFGGFPAHYLRDEKVASLINFLIDECPGLASYANPVPNNKLNSIRTCQFFIFSRPKAKMLKTVVDPIDDDAKIRAAFIAARWFEGIQ